MKAAAVVAVSALVVSACGAVGGEPTTTAAPGAAPTVTVSPPPPSVNPPACPEPPGAGPRVWVDVTDTWGVVEPLTGMFVHAAAWGDVDDDLRPDLVVGTFADRDPERYRVRGAAGPAPDRLLLGGADGFTSVDLPVDPGRTSGALFADLDADGDADLVLSRNAGLANQMPGGLVLFENQDADLRFAAAVPLPGFQARTVGAFDFDGDGLLDLAVAEDRYGDTGTRLLRNLGDWSFEDVTTRSGIGQVFGLGLTTVDLSGDGIPDLFVAGDNRLFLGVGDGTFRPVDSSAFAWERFGPEDLVGGVSAGDVNGDGLPDLVVGHHFNSTVDEGRRVPVRLYLNRGSGRFEDVTERAGLVGLPTKAPHVEVADLDNDGTPDILTSASAGDGPAVFWGLGVVDGVPRFEEPEGLGAAQYWVAAPTVDADGDGVLDVLLAEFDPSVPSRLLAGGGGGNWLEVSVSGPGRGIGALVELRAPDGTLLGSTEITATVGYSAGRMPVARFGLGEAEEVDVFVRFPDGSRGFAESVEVNRRIRWRSEGASPGLREFLISC